MDVVCPPDDVLLEYTSGRLDETKAASVADHVETCVQCSDTVREIERRGDPLFEQFRAGPPDNPYLKEPQCQAALEMARHVAAGEQTPHAASAFQSLSNAPPTRIRDYKILGRLGGGGMGNVYKAVHTSLGRRVALKLLPIEKTRSPEAIARFRREMGAVGRLDHPNLVRAIDAGEFDGQHFLAMEIVEGCDLAQLAKLVGPLSVADASEVVRQAAVGLQHVHENGLVHRDVKPSNLMLSGDGVVQVMDLGLALLDQRRFGSVEELTVTGQIMGTLDYMAPEQAASAQVDIRADIYGLGATLFKLLTGDAPLDTPELDTPLKKLAALADFQPPPIEDRRADLPLRSASLIHCMLASDPDGRPSTPAEVAAALEPLTAGNDLVSLCQSARAVSQSMTEHDFGDDGLASRTDSATWGDAGMFWLPSRQPKRWMPITVAAITLSLTALAVWWTAARWAPQDAPAARMTTASPKQATAPRGAVDSAVARAVLKIGGRMDVAWHDEEAPGRTNVRQLTDIEDLPPEPFRVQWIMLAGNPRVTDPLLYQIGKLRSLVGLTLQHTLITDDGVRQLGNIPTLTMLYLHGAPISDEGIRPVTELTNLQELTLTDTKITDLTLQRLAEQPHLERLYVKGTRITDEGLKYIGEMTSLHWLDLRETQVTDAGLVHLRSLVDLEDLFISKTAVTDRGLVHLKSLSHLRLLLAVKTAVTSDGAATLQAALPNCQVRLRD